MSTISLYKGLNQLLNDKDHEDISLPQFGFRLEAQLGTSSLNEHVFYIHKI